MSGKRPTLQVFDEWSLREAVDDAAALEAMERAFSALAAGEVLTPPPLGLDLDEVHGEVHVKGAYIRGAPCFAFKVATGFYGNVQLGVPTGSGMVLIFDSETGFPLGVLADNGFLTDLRTAAAGALAARHLAPEGPLRVGVVGAGIQARFQLRLLAGVRDVETVRVWSRTTQHAEHCAGTVAETLDAPVETVSTVEDAVAEADLVLTVTPSRTPLLQAGWLADGVTVLAVGSDGPEKRELAPEILASADKVVTDLTEQCLRLGELHHAVEAGLMVAGEVHAELGEIVLGERPGREGDETIVCDLTGVGVQDAAIAEAAYREMVGFPEEDA